MGFTLRTVVLCQIDDLVDLRLRDRRFAATTLANLTQLRQTLLGEPCHANSSPTPETPTTTARSQCWPHRQPPSAAPWPAPPPDAHPTATAPTTRAPHVVLPTSPTAGCPPPRSSGAGGRKLIDVPGLRPGAVRCDLYPGPSSCLGGGPIPVDAAARFSNHSRRFAHDADAGVGKMGVWLLSTSWCWHRRDARADMLCDPTGRCCGPSLAHVVDTPHGGAIAVKSSTGPRWPSIAGC